MRGLCFLDSGVYFCLKGSVPGKFVCQRHLPTLHPLTCMLSTYILSYQPLRTAIIYASIRVSECICMYVCVCARLYFYVRLIHGKYFHNVEILKFPILIIFNYIFFIFILIIYEYYSVHVRVRTRIHMYVDIISC